MQLHELNQTSDLNSMKQLNAYSKQRTKIYEYDFVVSVSGGASFLRLRMRTSILRGS